ncbi:MAG: segregation/condensation protein A [Chloroflexi bacterium]|nr:segregation/condensation protein A [Chloroflexota bacterium]
MPSTHSITNRSQTLGAAYAVTLPLFQGPLDLLLQLIEKQELDINEISLVTVTDQYLQTIDQMQEIEPDALADFLVVASRLLYIKSRSLLPQPRPPEEEEEDSTDALIKQLLEYRQFKQVAESLRAREDLGLRAYTRTAPRPVVEKHLDLSNVDLSKLHAVLRKVLQRIPSDPPMPRVKTYPITVAEQIENVRQYLQSNVSDNANSAPISFIEILGRSWTRIEVIVTFLAILELIKQRQIHVIQDGLFGEIMLMLVTEEMSSVVET